MPLGRMPRLAADYLVEPADPPYLEHELATLIEDGGLGVSRSIRRAAGQPVVKVAVTACCR